MHIEASAFNLRRSPMQRGWLALRYVDNLLTLHNVQGNRSFLPNKLTNANFYGESIILEFETKFEHLGLNLVPWGQSFHVEVLVPGYAEVEEFVIYPPALTRFRWRYKSTESAGSLRGIASGFISRLHTAARFGHPRSRGREAVAKLLVLAVLTRQHRPILRQTIKKHCKRYPAVYTAPFRTDVMRSLHLEHDDCISGLRKIVGQSRRQRSG